jgi:hypothetical protein
MWSALRVQVTQQDNNDQTAITFHNFKSVALRALLPNERYIIEQKKTNLLAFFFYYPISKNKMTATRRILEEFASTK